VRDEPVSLSCWMHRGKVYVDAASCRQLAAETRARWDQLAQKRGRPPVGDAVLTRVEVTPKGFALGRTRSARFWIFRT